MTRPRILFVSPRIFFPLNSGTKIRINHLIQALTKVGDVDLVTFGGAPGAAELPSSPADGPSWWAALRSVQVVPHPHWKELEREIYRKRVGQRLIGRHGLLNGSLPIEPMRRRVRQLASNADLIWAVHLYTAAGLSADAQKTIVDFNDFESAKTARQGELETLPYMRWAFRREAARLARDERAAVERYARVAVCSPVDARALGKSTGNRVWTIPNGVDDALFSAPPIDRIPARLVFV